MTFHRCFSRKICQLLVRFEVLRPTVWISAVIEGIHADEDVKGVEHFSPGEREREEDRISGRNVRNRDTSPHLFDASALGNRRITGKSGSTEQTQVYIHDNVLCNSVLSSNFARCLDFNLVTLSVTEGESVQLEALRLCNGQNRRGIKSATQQHNCFLPAHFSHLSSAVKQLQLIFVW